MTLGDTLVHTTQRRSKCYSIIHKCDLSYGDFWLQYIHIANCTITRAENVRTFFGASEALYG